MQWRIGDLTILLHGSSCLSRTTSTSLMCQFGSCTYRTSNISWLYLLLLLSVCHYHILLSSLWLFSLSVSHMAENCFPSRRFMLLFDGFSGRPPAARTDKEGRVFSVVAPLAVTPRHSAWLTWILIRGRQHSGNILCQIVEPSLASVENRRKRCGVKIGYNDTKTDGWWELNMNKMTL